MWDTASQQPGGQSLPWRFLLAFSTSSCLCNTPSLPQSTLTAPFLFLWLPRAGGLIKGHCSLLQGERSLMVSPHPHLHLRSPPRSQSSSGTNKSPLIRWLLSEQLTHWIVKSALVFSWGERTHAFALFVPSTTTTTVSLHHLSPTLPSPAPPTPPLPPPTYSFLPPLQPLFCLPPLAGALRPISSSRLWSAAAMRSQRCPAVAASATAARSLNRQPPL